jgi:broad specificity phosphatase PhoE
MDERRAISAIMQGKLRGRDHGHERKLRGTRRDDPRRRDDIRAHALVPTVLLVRHAQASFGADDYDVLSALGIEQSHVLERELLRRGVSLDRVVTGTLRRQRDTVASLAAIARKPGLVDARWDEYSADDVLGAYSDSPVRLSAPRASGMTTGEFQQILDQALFGWIAAGEQRADEESWRAFCDRVNAALDGLLDMLGPGETALVCTSGGVLAAICVRLLNAGGAAFVPFNRVAVNTGITKVVRGRRGTTLVSFNEHGHLEQPGGSLLTYR